MKKCNPWNAGVRLGGDRSIHLSYVPESGAYLILKHFSVPPKAPNS